MEEIICVLDKSGSMGAVRDDAKNGFNAFVEDQLKVRDAQLTVVFFDHTFQVAHEGRLSEFKPLERWPVEGMTALLDAIGKTFAHVNPRLAREKPEKVIMAILTDGHENSSQEYTMRQIADTIKEHRDKYGWEVIFLAADQDAWGVAQHMGIAKQDTQSYDSVDTKKGFANYSASVTSRRA